MWWYVACVLVVSFIFIITFLIGYAIHHLTHREKEILTSRNVENGYLIKPSRCLQEEVDYGVPYTSRKPVNVQPYFKNRHLTDTSTSFDQNHNDNSNTWQPNVEDYHVPLISHYESNQTASRNNTKRKNVSKTYGRQKSRRINSPAIVISQISDNATARRCLDTHDKPQLTYSIFYDRPSKDLHITVFGASNLPASEQPNQNTRYYRVHVLVEACETKWQKTRYVCGTRNPVFNETFIVSGLAHNKLRECCLRFRVVEYEEIKYFWSTLGEIIEPMVDLRANMLFKSTKTLCEI